MAGAGSALFVSARVAGPARARQGTGASAVADRGRTCRWRKHATQEREGQSRAIPEPKNRAVERKHPLAWSAADANEFSPPLPRHQYAPDPRRLKGVRKKKGKSPQSNDQSTVFKQVYFDAPPSPAPTARPLPQAGEA